MNTELIYMYNMNQLHVFAIIVDIEKNENNTTLILDKTIFYPQGGGQPYDTGIIHTEDKSLVFEVQEVRFIDGRVHHIGQIQTGVPTIGMTIECEVQANRRALNSRLHSAGHLVDVALKELNIDWIPGKGYHFPEGAYIEYMGSLENIDTDKLKYDIENTCADIISRDLDTKIVFDTQKLQNGKPLRTVFYGDFGIHCGGTHVHNLSDIGKVTIRKIKKEKENVRISYNV